MPDAPPDPQETQPPAQAEATTATATPAGPQPISRSTGAQYRVALDAYAGPMDLLLYLVQKHEIDLHNIPMAQLTEQYLGHLQVIRTLSTAPGSGVDIDAVGEFLVMAATLVEIKSRMIAPPPEEPDPETDSELAGDSSPADELAQAVGDPADPRYELVQQLLAYKKFKDAALNLEERYEHWSARAQGKAAAGAAEPDPDEAEQRSFDLEDLDLMDLAQAFGRLLETVGTGPGPHEVVDDDTPLELYAADLEDRLKRDGPMTLERVFEGRTRRTEMIGLFLATLELVRQRKVKVTQDGLGPIGLEVRPPEDALIAEVSADGEAHPDVAIAEDPDEGDGEAHADADPETGDPGGDDA